MLPLGASCFSNSSHTFTRAKFSGRPETWLIFRRCCLYVYNVIYMNVYDGIWRMGLQSAFIYFICIYHLFCGYGSKCCPKQQHALLPFLPGSQLEVWPHVLVFKTGNIWQKMQKSNNSSSYIARFQNPWKVPRKGPWLCGSRAFI
jgi:hypothetical protein